MVIFDSGIGFLLFLDEAITWTKNNSFSITSSETNLMDILATFNNKIEQNLCLKIISIQSCTIF